MCFNLPVGPNPKALDFPHFPTRQQAVVWRNWGLVSVKKIAGVLRTGCKEVIELATGMGLVAPSNISEYWLEHGYITIIRRNWHLLTYEQILGLLECTSEELAYVLKEDDFLWIKLGELKPLTEPVIYRNLTDLEKQETEKISTIIRRNFDNQFNDDFINVFVFLQERSETFNSRITNACAIADINEIKLDGTWCIKYDVLDEKVKTFIDRFVSEHRKKWGYTIKITSVHMEKPIITLEIRKDTESLSESHRIEVKEKAIKIIAIDEAGLLRGLQWMEKQMEIRGGPLIKKGIFKRNTRYDLRMIYTYLGVHGDPFLKPEADPYPDWYLDKLSKIGINGIWLQGVLYKLVPYDFAPELSLNWQIRINGLKNLVTKAAGYGIGMYLYLNEPRAMPLEFFKKHPELKGSQEGNLCALCTSREEVQSYLKNAVKRLFTEVPDLAGVFTITMSENLTNCYSRAYNREIECPRCKKKTPQKIIAEVNNIIAGAAHSVKPDARVICWTWGWSPEWSKQAIELLSSEAELMCTSEEAVPTSIAGVKGKVIDYSMSNTGPGERALSQWKIAKLRGLRTNAKVQFNNTWECSAVPYLPVIQLVKKHLKNHNDAGINGLMLSWTLGGYPSLNLELASIYYWSDSSSCEHRFKDAVNRRFGSDISESVIEAMKIFSTAFKEFPFCIQTLYFAPQNVGPMNLLFEKSTGFKATMIGYPYDDIESWRGIYPPEIFEMQFKRLSNKWKSGLNKLENVKENAGGNEAFGDLWNVSSAAYCHFRSTYLQISYIRKRECLNKTDDNKKYKKIVNSIMNILDEEINIAKELYKIAVQDSRIGFEPSNHYYYTPQDLKEKVICCEYLKGRFCGE